LLFERADGREVTDTILLLLFFDKKVKWMEAIASAAKRRTPPIMRTIERVPKPKIIPSSGSGSITGSIVGSGFIGSWISMWAS